MPSYSLDPCIEGELWDIWEFIARDNPTAATEVVEAAFATFKILAASPRIGTKRKFRSQALRDVRTLPVKGYRDYLVFYRPSSGGVQIHHILHGARDLVALMEDSV